MDTNSRTGNSIVDRNNVEQVSKLLWRTDNYASATLNASLHLVTNSVVCVVLFVFLAVNDFASVLMLSCFLGGAFWLAHSLVRPRMRDLVNAAPNTILS